MGFEDVKMVIRVVQRVEQLAIRRDVERGDRGPVLGASSRSSTPGARVFPTLFVPVARSIGYRSPDSLRRSRRRCVCCRGRRPVRSRIAPWGRWRPPSRWRGRRCAAPVLGIAGVGEGEESAVRTDLSAENHVAGCQLSAGGRSFPAADQHRIGAVFAGHGDVLAGGGMFHSIVFDDGGPGAASQHHEHHDIGDALHSFFSSFSDASYGTETSERDKEAHE